MEVTLKPTAKAGHLAEQLHIKTSDPAHPLVQIAISANIASPLELAPGKVRFDTVAVGQSAAQRVIVRAARPFKILGIDGAGAGVSVELPAAAAPVPVQFVTVKFDPTQPGRVARILRIRTDLGGAIASLAVDGEGVVK